MPRKRVTKPKEALSGDAKQVASGGIDKGVGNQSCQDNSVQVRPGRLQVGVRWLTDEPGQLTREELETAAECMTVTQRVEWLELFLSSGRYRPRRTEHELAQVWGVASQTVRNMSAEAGRRLASDHSPERHEEIRARLVARIYAIGDAALNRRKEVLNMAGEPVAVLDPDCRTALQSVVEAATLLNIREERWRGRVDVTALTEEQILEQLAAVGYVVKKEEKPALLAEGEAADAAVR